MYKIEGLTALEPADRICSGRHPMPPWKIVGLMSGIYEFNSGKEDLRK